MLDRSCRRQSVLAMAMLMLAGCSALDEAGAPLADEPSERMVLVGDSLAEEAMPYLVEAVEPMAVSAHSFAGTAPCDWLGEDLDLDGADVVAISFSGNALTACMTDDAGAPLQGLALIDRYRADVATIANDALRAGARVVIVGQPINGVSPEANQTIDALNVVYGELAAELGASFVDAGAAVEAPDGSFARELPCRPVDPDCPESGSIPVRSDDGGHFCPGAATPGMCPLYSSGASRFAAAIAQAVEV